MLSFRPSFRKVSDPWQAIRNCPQRFVGSRIRKVQMNPKMMRQDFLLQMKAVEPSRIY